jgi:ABC-type multidrug transport system ATPase subunit
MAVGAGDPVLVGGKLILIIGQSGAGKSATLLTAAGAAGMPARPRWDSTKAVVSQFEGGPDAAREWLGRTGLNSVPSWVKPLVTCTSG